MSSGCSLQGPELPVSGRNLMRAAISEETDQLRGVHDMDLVLRKAFIRSLTEVFEKMYFAVLKPSAEPELAASPEAYLEAVIAYGGAREGRIRLYFPEPLARYATHIFMGVAEDQLTEAQMLDTIRETANITVGSFLGELDPSGACRLGIPQSRRCSDFSAAAAGSHAGSCAFDSDFGVLWLICEES
jgi:CheY-specific phosphatase CheX